MKKRKVALTLETEQVLAITDLSSALTIWCGQPRQRRSRLQPTSACNHLAGESGTGSYIL